MEYTNIKFNIENGIAHLVLARDDIRNAFSEKDFTDEIVDAIERTQLSEDARVLVLSAEGSAFSAGGNIKDMKDKKGIFARSRRYSSRVYRRHPESAESPLHAGHPVDLRCSGTGNWRRLRSGAVLRHRSRLRKGEIRRDFHQRWHHPGRFGGWIVPRRVGLQRAAELIFTGRVVGGEEAAEIGLALECVAPDSCAARDGPGRDDRRTPAGYRSHAEIAASQSLSSGLFDFLDNCAALQAICHSTDDHIEAVTAMLEKRAPTFEGK